MKGMKPGQVVAHLWEYYRFHLLVLALVLFFAIGLGKAMFGKKPETVFSAVLVNVGGVEEEACQALETQLADLLELDPETQLVDLRTVTVMPDNALVSLQSLMLQVVSGETDLFLCTGDIANYLLKSGAVSDLGSVLSAETLDRYGDKLIYADAEELTAWTEASQSGSAPEVDLLHSTPEGLVQPVAVAIEMTEQWQAVLGGMRSDGPLYGAVAVTTDRQENLDRVLQWLAETAAGS